MTAPFGRRPFDRQLFGEWAPSALFPGRWPPPPSKASDADSEAERDAELSKAPAVDGYDLSTFAAELEALYPSDGSNG